VTGAIEYHERTKHSPRSLREDDFRRDPGNRPAPFKRYRGVPTRTLAERIRPPMTPALAAVAGEGPTPAAEKSLDLAALSTLCYCSAGVTSETETRSGTHHSRAASCTGALYHVDLYLVCGDLDGLDAGIYHFDPETFSLDVLREGDYRGTLSAASDHDGVADAPVTVVTTSRWWANAWKYRDRTFRHAWWDSGTVVANLLATARALEVPSEAVLGFADGPVADLLGVDPREEAPLELVPVGSGDPVPDPRDPGPIHPAVEPLSPDPRDHPLIHEAWRAGTLDSDTAAADWRSGGDESVGTRSPGEGERFELDPVGPERASKRPLYHAIRRRTSCREYDRDPLSYRALSTVLDRAIRPAPIDAWGEDGALQFNDCYLLVTGVEDLPDGAYQFHAGEGTLERIGDTGREAKTHLALDQGWAGDAAVNCYFLTDLGEVVDAFGDRGYRLAQFEAALAGGRLYLATYAHRRLGGLGLTFFDDVVTDHLRPRAAGQTPTFLYALGRRDDLE
jgi:SagB-type dehydrogenase family enzyme